MLAMLKQSDELLLDTLTIDHDQQLRDLETINKRIRIREFELSRIDKTKHPKSYNQIKAELHLFREEKTMLEEEMVEDDN